MDACSNPTIGARVTVAARRSLPASVADWHLPRVGGAGVHMALKANASLCLDFFEAVAHLVTCASNVSRFTMHDNLTVTIDATGRAWHGWCLDVAQGNVVATAYS